MQGACLSLRGGEADAAAATAAAAAEASWVEGRGLIASAGRGVAEGMD